MKTTLSELECAVLGVVWQRGRCSAYAVAKEFAPVSSGWSASAGSIYPLLGKLHTLGLISFTEQVWGKGRKRLYELSPAGRSALKKWLLDLAEWTGAVPADPIRTRSFFLGALGTTKDRLRFFDRSILCTRQALQDIALVQAATTGPGAKYELLGLAGARLQLNAKLEWLNQARSAIAQNVTADDEGAKD